MKSSDPSHDENPVPATTDDELRRLAAERLAQHLDMGAALVARCRDLAQAGRGDRLGPLGAAARLLRANAHVAQTLAHVALVERRQRTIIERVQTPDPETAELNSEKLTRREEAEHRLKYWRRMSEHVEDAIRIRTGQSQGRERIAEIIKQAEQELEQIEREEGYRR